jgi:predicted Zn finger-like uncharacterized protein
MSVIVVTCESCATKFRLDSERLTKPRNKVRCSRCKAVFTVPPPSEDNLVRIDLSDEEPEEESFVPGSMVEVEVQPEVEVKPPKKPRAISIRRILLIAAPALVLVAAVLLFIFSPSLPTIPIGKSEQPESPQAAASIQDTLQAYFLENSHAGQVFVVEGEVKNVSNKPLSFILLEGKLYTTNHQIAQTQRCYLGNILSRQEIAGLKPAEIQDRMMNREGKSFRNVRIPPGSKVPFMLVFHNLPELKALGDYSVEVVGSKIE